jgi:DNA-binding NtrC family response regulator
MGKAVDTIPSETMTALVRYGWPGNVRELQGVIERAVILSNGPVLDAVAERVLHTPFRSKVGVLDDNDLSIEFDPSLSPEQIASTLTALANYYRACGGVGLPVEFENQEAITEGVHV